MPNYRRAKIKGGTYFFTLTLANRSSDLLVREIARLRRAYADAQQRRPFETLADGDLPMHWGGDIRGAPDDIFGE